MESDNATTPMQSLDKLQETYLDEFKQGLMLTHHSVISDVERIQNIINAKYTNAICGFLRSVEKTNINSFLLMTQNYDSGLPLSHDML